MAHFSAVVIPLDRTMATGRTTCGTHNKYLNAPVIKLLSKGVLEPFKPAWLLALRTYNASLPFYRRRRLRGDIVQHAIDALYFSKYTVGNHA